MFQNIAYLPLPDIAGILAIIVAIGISIFLLILIKSNKHTPSISSTIKQQLAISGLRSFMKMLLWDNFVHADLHPGNILVRFDPNPKIVFLDTGLVTELSRRDHYNFADLFKM